MKSTGFFRRLAACGAGLSYGIAPETVLHHIAYDNKRGYRSCDGSEVAMVLLRAVGAPLNAEQRYLTPVPQTLVTAAVHDLLRRGKECTAGHGPS